MTVVTLGSDHGDGIGSSLPPCDDSDCGQHVGVLPPRLLWVPNRSSMSGNLGIFVDQSTERVRNTNGVSGIGR
jgi:hypothetical protein